jgi:hypothetical protein
MRTNTDGLVSRGAVPAWNTRKVFSYTREREREQGRDEKRREEGNFQEFNEEKKNSTQKLDEESGAHCNHAHARQHQPHTRKPYVESRNHETMLKM